MTTVDIIATDGEQVGAVELPPDIFDVQANIALMHQVVVAQLAAARQGTHKTKTRGEFTGGGVVHGPVPRDYSQRTPKKMKAAALRGALSDRARAGRITVVETFVDDETPSTKAALRVLSSVAKTDKVLVVLGRDEQVSWLSLRNVPTVHLLAADQLNTYDVLVADEVVFTAAGLGELLGSPVEVEGRPAASDVDDTEAEAEAEAEESDVDTEETDEEAEE